MSSLKSQAPCKLTATIRWGYTGSACFSVFLIRNDGRFLSPPGTVAVAEDITAPTTPVPTRTKDPPAGDIVQWQWLRTDPESAITPYAYAVGRTKGGNDVADWKVTSHTSLEFGPATLGQTLYISVKARSGFARWS